MPSLADFFFGPRVDNEQGPPFLRSFVMNANTVFAVLDRLEIFSASEEEAGNRTNPPGADIRDLRTQSVITRDQLLNKSSYELRSIMVSGHGEGFRVDNGRLQLESWAPLDDTTKLNREIVRIIEGLSRPRIIWRRIWILLPWLFTGAAIALFVIAVTSNKVQLVELLALGLLIAVTAMASAGISVLIWRSVRRHFPPSIIRPYLWRDIIARRITVWIGIAAAILGGGIGALITALVR